MLSLLLDENISPEVARQILIKRPEVSILSVHHWHGAAFKARRDELILAAALIEGLTLVTYDQRTILPLLVQWGQGQKDHAGVIFIDERTIAPSDFGSLVRSLITLWDQGHDDQWTNAITYLGPG